MIHAKPEHPTAARGFHVGDHVITPLGRRATITGLRFDGYIDAVYEGEIGIRGMTILQPSMVRRA